MTMNPSILGYDGRLSSDVRVQLTDLLAAIALANLGKRTDLRKLCSIAIELLDNAQRHCTGDTIHFSWRIVGSDVVVSVQNRAQGQDALRLKAQVDSVLAMTNDEITEAFKAQMMNPEFGEKGGAGLGILQIVKKGGKNYEVELEPTDNHNEYLCKSHVKTSLVA
jgi:hypothetical protein